MTSDTQKDAEIAALRRILIDGIKSVGGNATDDVSDDFLSYLPLEIAGKLDQQKQDIAALRTAFNKFALNVMVAAIEGVADAAIVKQAIYTEHTSLAAVRTLAEKHKSLRDQAEKYRRLVEAAEKFFAIQFPVNCIHDSEPWFCDGCKVVWEHAIGEAKVALRSALDALKEKDYESTDN